MTTNTQIPAGALLVLTQHLADVAQSSRRGCQSIAVEGTTGGQADRFQCAPQVEGSFALSDKFYGRQFNVAVTTAGDTTQFTSNGGDLAVDLKAQANGYNLDILGTIDHRNVEYHYVVRSGVNEHGSIDSVPFNYNRWAEQHGVLLKGSMDGKPIQEVILNDTVPHPSNTYVQTWQGPCGGVTVNERVTYTQPTT